MNIIIDACSLINLHNAGCLEPITKLGAHEFWVGPIVLGECSGACAAEVWRLLNEGLLLRLHEDEIDAERYLELLVELNLGPGETECLAVAEALGFSICTDDGLARSAVSNSLGNDRLVGTARLLQWSVMDEIMKCNEATARFQAMKREGGYLPNLEHGFFCTP